MAEPLFDTQPPARPELTFPQAEGAALRLAYEEADVILEYGSGGSTVLASELPGKRVTSVESDGAWVRRMRGWFAAHPPARGTEVEVIHADIGPTENWGYPADTSGWQSYASYPLSVWDRPGMTGRHHPDVVLVDGRFRLGCVLATAYRITRPVTLLLDDYKNRKHYHKIEKYVGAPTLIGRLAVFDIAPMAVSAERLLDITRMMTRP